jgi:hypothetical protein
LRSRSACCAGAATILRAATPCGYWRRTDDFKHSV